MKRRKRDSEGDPQINIMMDKEEMPEMMIHKIRSECIMVIEAKYDLLI